jgi:hypothetical protein
MVQENTMDFSPITTVYEVEQSLEKLAIEEFKACKIRKEAEKPKHGFLDLPAGM